MDRKTATGEKRSRDARVIRTRAALRDALASLLQNHDLAAVTVQMIVAEARIGYATFFRHHSSVEGLLIDVADTMMVEFTAAAMPAILTGDRATMLSALAEFVQGRRATVHALLAGGGATVRAEIVRRAMAQASPLSTRFDTAIPIELAITHAVTCTIDTLQWWTDEGNTASPTTVAELIDRLALRPLTRPGIPTTHETTAKDD